MEFMYAYIAIAIIISFIPVLKSIFATIHTLIHETGHALAALLTSGKVYSISLYSTTDGVACTGSRSWWSSVVVTYAGYTFSSLIAILAFFLIANEETVFLFYIFLLIALINLLLWVRNKFGVLWLLLYIAGSLVIIHYQWNILKEIVVYLLSSVILVQSVLASFTILILSMTNSKQAGDAKGLQKLTLVPAFVWGIIFFSQSLLATYYVIVYLI
ncbi:M50 family metallopeptidase [Halalkalibacter alkalisediminis]|uniref:M50 family metallopeptidase n=1 Tax=Halalkalibacter alkalisediminis TaxID=935616 RepID=A0ABV6NFV3_9BACI|nr:M50 family metallopeptidase [Halalkalibacter alkalisediminis]